MGKQTMVYENCYLKRNHIGNDTTAALNSDLNWIKT